MARTARKKIGIYDNGILLTDDVNSLDFTGAGVFGSVDSQGNVIENISGGSSGGTLAFEIPTPPADGMTTVFTVLNTPLYIVINQQTYFENDGYDFDSGTMEITLTGAPVPPTGSTFMSAYMS